MQECMRIVEKIKYLGCDNMCVAIPGKVIEINGKMGKVDFNGNIIEVNISLVDVEVGSYVLVHAGYAVETVKREQAEELTNIFADLEDALNDES
jgi:hydrogenase expression/formation protein HypC